ncbi:BCCT family transporter [Parasedimentitalea psychrophila]|uniref:BCCT family transporter n=1 Tax=Parasedimentitalea psychrophila TaxID=2997337 RepID=A0A9Y2P5C7_9RHOB|nr:BCCT family transporter [Parasedimentitalea psychrophila]WIY23838.1 BCCT family transporter [Parasedimentitalea psychrophila]
MKLNALLIVALTISAAIAVWGIIDPQGLGALSSRIVDAQFSSRGWFIMLEASGLLLVAIYLALSPFGSIRLGPDGSRPEFSTPAWIAMLFAAGMGVGLLFYGAAEPLTHFSVLRQFSNDPKAASLALFVTYLNWGFHAWAIYGIVGLVIGYFAFRRSRSLLLSAPLIDVYGKHRWTRSLGWFFDLMSIVAIAVGLAGSLAMGVFQIQTGVAGLIGVENSNGLTAFVFVAMCAAFFVPLRRDLGDGMAKLSNLAMIIALGLMVFLLVFGPTSYIMNSIVSGFGRYVFNVLPAGFSTAEFFDGQVVDWFQGWTLNYMIWWLAWSPFVGIFIARISRGRTIREFLVGVIVAPTLFSVFWFGVFGTIGFSDALRGDATLLAVNAESLDATTFALLQHFPFNAVTQGATILAAFLFVVTSVVSAGFTLAMIGTGGDENPSPRIRTVWGAVLAALGLAMIFVGDIGLIRSVIALSAIAFVFIVPILVVCLLRSLHKEAAK